MTVLELWQSRQVFLDSLQVNGSGGEIVQTDKSIPLMPKFNVFNSSLVAVADADADADAKVNFRIHGH